jgi:tetratricopeptide (TPR) repeat protein
MAACANCGREVADDMNFCPYCGQLVKREAQQDTAMARMIEDARRAVDKDPKDAFARYNLALGYKMTGLKELALQELRRVAEQEPEFADAFYEIAALQAEQGRTDIAIPSLRRALQLDPEHMRARRLLARIEGEGAR